MSNHLIFDNWIIRDNNENSFLVEGWGMENGQKKIYYFSEETNAVAIMNMLEESPFYITWLELIFEGAE